MIQVTPAGAFRVRLVGLLTAAYVAFVLLVTLWPTTVDHGLDPYIERVLDRLHDRGVPGFVDYGFVEWSANVVFFVPVGFLAFLLLSRRIAWLAAPAGALLSTAIETTQGLLLPGRVASAADVAANTLGAVLGCLIASALRAVILHRDRLVVADVLAGRRVHGGPAEPEGMRPDRVPRPERGRVT